MGAASSVPQYATALGPDSFITELRRRKVAHDEPLLFDFDSDVESGPPAAPGSVRAAPPDIAEAHVDAAGGKEVEDVEEDDLTRCVPKTEAIGLGVVAQRPPEVVHTLRCPSGAVGVVT